MIAKDFLMRHLGCTELPSSLSIEQALGAINAAAIEAAEKTSDFDEERIQNLRNGLNTIAEHGRDRVSSIVAKRALINDEAFQ